VWTLESESGKYIVQVEKRSGSSHPEDYFLSYTWGFLGQNHGLLRAVFYHFKSSLFVALVLQISFFSTRGNILWLGQIIA
jgi:hypothetical protein